MKKAMGLTITIVLMLVLSSCTKGISTMFFSDKDNNLADTRMEQLFNAIEQQSKNALIENFSKKALEKTEDIDVDVDHLLSFIQGDVVSWNRDESPIVFDNIEAGGKVKQLVTWYTLDTSEQNYFVLLVDYPIDTIDPENVGLYSICILRSEDENKLTGTWEDWAVPGINILDN